MNLAMTLHLLRHPRDASIVIANEQSGFRHIDHKNSDEWSVASGEQKRPDQQGRIAPDSVRIEEEVGDLLFTVANLARFLRSDPETCLRRANRKFADRFRQLEQEVARRGKRVRDCTAEELDEIWEAVKEEQTVGGRR